MSNTRYTDTDGDIWEDWGGGFVKCVRRFGDPIEDGATVTLAELIAQHGPISLAPDACADVRAAALDKLRRQSMAEVLIGTDVITVVDQAESGALTVNVGGDSYVVDVTVEQVGA